MTDITYCYTRQCDTLYLYRVQFQNMHSITTYVSKETSVVQKRLPIKVNETRKLMDVLKTITTHASMVLMFLAIQFNNKRTYCT